MNSYSLNPKIAQQIVERTMKIIDCNINVMDAHGCIIGSGDLERIGELHEGAMLAISQKRTVSIDSIMVKRLQGVKAGINLPLKLNDRIVGVIGLTGEPSDIWQFGELVRMSAEMMMEQTHLLQELSYDNRLKEELVLTLIEKETLPSSMAQWVKRLDIDLKSPLVVGIIEVDSGQLGIDTAMSELQNLQSQIQILSKHNLVAIKSITELVMLIPALNRYRRWDLLEHKKKLEQLIVTIKNTTQLDIRISLGNYFDQHPYPLIKSYQTAKTTMLIGKQKMPNIRNYYYQELILPVLLHELSYDWQAEELLLPLKKLRQGDNNGVLQNTLQTWFKNNVHNGDTANELFIHRNTLEYRLNKIAKLTGLNLTKFDDRLLLYIGLQLNKS
ncbi:transcriptional regulator [Gilliamella sp. Choc5-1]|uniref:sugar diacid recognition domain-containing protein n=1 Tax=Gilliamella sp. Choc5-1 TaxID=3120238 RepID=UPI00080ED07E|nr:transcriptional regulator [Gilliamella apicola]